MTWQTGATRSCQPPGSLDPAVGQADSRRFRPLFAAIAQTAASTLR
jgi:hypothetical protein